MESWAQSGEFDVNFICICVNGDKTALPTAKEFGSKFRMTASLNGFISQRAALPSFGQLGCQGLILVDANGSFITKRSPAFLQHGEKAFRRVEKQLFQLGAYRGSRTAESFEEPPLRFGVGTRVECRVGRTLWLPGRITAERVAQGSREMPYQIILDDGRALFAPIDSDQVIRKLRTKAEVPSVGHAEMDREHGECLEALESLRSERSDERLRAAYDTLRKHFDHEEELFAEHAFGNHGTALSGTKSHCDDHARILADLKAKFGSPVTVEFVESLIEHIVAHTRDYDSKYEGQLGATAV